MSNVNKLRVDTEPYAKLANISMTPSEREEAIHALGVGEAIAGAILWLSDGITRRFASASTKRGFKHEIAA